MQKNYDEMQSLGGMNSSNEFNGPVNQEISRKNIFI